MSVEIMAALARIESKLDRLLTAPTGARPTKDQPVRKDPKSWKGASCEGKQYSECPPAYLEELSRLFDWMADRDDEAGARGEVDPRGYAKSGKWKRMDAALARSWAAYLNAPKGAAADTGDDTIPF
jgi:hypothetical protein